MRLPYFLRRRRSRCAPPLFTLADLDRFRRNRNEAWIRSLCRHVRMAEREALCIALGRFKMFVDPTDYSVSAHLILDGYWEMWLTEVMAAVLKNGMTAVDVGANVGYFSMVMADIVGSEGRVHAFEANDEIAARLVKSAYINGFGKTLSVHATAVGDVDGEEATLIIPPGQSGGAYLSSPGEHGENARRVSTRRLDSYPELLDADVIKIDVEGAEEAVWRGMEGILARGRPLTIFLEYCAMRYADPKAFLEEIVRWGLRIEVVDIARGVVPSTIDLIVEEAREDERMLVLRR